MIIMPSNMGTWKVRKLEKKRKQSQTKGKEKGESCKSSPLDRTMCRRNRSYKHRYYSQWYIKKNGDKKGGTRPK